MFSLVVLMFVLVFIYLFAQLLAQSLLYVYTAVSLFWDRDVMGLCPFNTIRPVGKKKHLSSPNYFKILYTKLLNLFKGQEMPTWIVV